MESLVVHWDGILLIDLNEKMKVDRLSVVISFDGNTQLLGVPKLRSETGENQAKAIFEVLDGWEMVEKVQAVCCDTTASNTGRINGFIDGYIYKNIYIFRWSRLYFIGTAYKT